MDAEHWEVPIVPKPEFREALQRYMISRLEEVGVGPKTVEQIVNLNIEKVEPWNDIKSKITYEIQYNLKHCCCMVEDLKKDLKRIYGELRLEDLCSFGDAALWLLGVRRAVVEFIHDLLLERPDLTKAVDLWLVGRMLDAGELKAATELLELNGYEVPPSPTRVPELKTTERVHRLGHVMTETILTAHALSNRVDSSSFDEAVGKVRNWFKEAQSSLRNEVQKEDSSELVVKFIEGLRDTLEDLIRKTLEHGKPELEEVNSTFELLGIDDLGSFFSRACGEFKRAVDYLVEVVEFDPGRMAKNLLRASPEIELGDRTLEPEVYDPRWSIFERDLSELDRITKEMIEELVTETDRSSSEREAPPDPLSEVVDSVVKEALDKRRGNS